MNEYEATSETKEWAVVVTGSVLSGFKFTGPFESTEAAVQWYETCSLDFALGLKCTVVLLDCPRVECLDRLTEEAQDQDMGY